MDDWDIYLTKQCSNSPDHNILDLAFFMSLQSRQWRSGFAKDIDGLIEQVTNVYWAYPPVQLDHSFITLQTVLDETLKNRGSNNYKIPHIGRNQLRENCKLPRNFLMSQEAKIVLMNFGKRSLPLHNSGKRGAYH